MSGTMSNPIAFNAYTNYTINTLHLNSTMRRLATGVKSVVDDGASVAISERMRAQANSSAKARSNVENAISLLQTADAWLQQVNDMLGRMHELAVDANDATKTPEDRSNVQTEFVLLQSEISRITDSAAKFNGGLLFDGTHSAQATQVGADSNQTINMDLTNLLASADTNLGGMPWSTVLNAATTFVGSTAGATTAINTLTSAINGIAQQRASVGAQQERFEKTRAALLVYEDQIRTAESKVRTVDTARESSEMMKYQILTQIGTAMLAQANQLPASTVQLVSGR